MTVVIRTTASLFSVADLDAELARIQDDALAQRPFDDKMAAVHAARHGMATDLRERIADWLAEEQRVDPDEEWQRLKAEGYDEAALRRAAGDR